METKGRTLEELDEVFEAPNPRKASTVKLRIGGMRRGMRRLRLLSELEYSAS